MVMPNNNKNNKKLSYRRDSARCGCCCRAKQTVLTNRETAIQGHSRSSVVMPIYAAYMTCH